MIVDGGNVLYLGCNGYVRIMQWLSVVGVG
jgi:hypothetical protein